MNNMFYSLKISIDGFKTLFSFEVFPVENKTIRGTLNARLSSPDISKRAQIRKPKLFYDRGTTRRKGFLYLFWIKELPLYSPIAKYYQERCDRHAHTLNEMNLPYEIKHSPKQKGIIMLLHH